MILYNNRVALYFEECVSGERERERGIDVMSDERSERNTHSFSTYVRIQILNIDDSSECDNDPLQIFIGLCCSIIFIYFHSICVSSDLLSIKTDLNAGLFQFK
jgi:hypothetical protein